MNSCGDCGSAYQEPGCRRRGTRKSRAPSGVERVRIGVSISRKSRSSSTSRIALMIRWRSAITSCIALAAQVERAVLEPQHLVDLDVVVVDRERRRLGLREQLELGDRELDLAGRQVRVDVARLAAHDLAARGDDVLGAQALGRRERLGAGPGGRRAARCPSGRAGR